MRLAFLFFVLLSSCGFAVEIPTKVYEHTITEIQLADDEDVTFVAVKPADNEVSEIATTFGVGITCPPGRYKAIVVAIKDGKFDRSRRAVRYFVCVGGTSPDPDPDPDPDNPVNPDVIPAPRPEGFAGNIYDEILKSKCGVESLKLAAAAKTVIDRLDAQTNNQGERIYNTPDVCVAAFVVEVKNQGLAEKWRPVLQWLANACKQNARTFPGVRAALEGIKIGAERAGGKASG